MSDAAALDEERFNLEIRKFLKKVGIASQREIERVVREAIKSGRLTGAETLTATMTLALPELHVSYRIDGEIAMG